jgi:hypothetical protein
VNEGPLFTTRRYRPPRRAEEPPLPESADAYGSSAPPPREDDEPRPRIVCPTIFKGGYPPSRRWIVLDWVPYGVVSGLYGDGGVGKSLLAQQLQTGTALGSTWLGLPVEEVMSLGVYCEDDENELWRRQCDINESYGVDHGALGSMHWMPRLGDNNLLMTFTRSGVGELTKFYSHVVEAALDLTTSLVIIDTAADTFGGNENDRNHVRQYVQRALGQIAIRIDGSVVCCAIPAAPVYRAARATAARPDGRTPSARGFTFVIPRPSQTSRPTRLRASSNARKPTTPREATS